MRVAMPRICSGGGKFQVKLGSKSLGTFKTREEAEGFKLLSARQVSERIKKENRPQLPKVVCLATLADSVWAKMTLSGYRSVRRYQDAFRMYIETQPLGQKPIGNLTRNDCQEWLNWLVKQKAVGKNEPLKPGSIANVRKALAIVCKYARIEGLLTTSTKIEEGLDVWRAPSPEKGNALTPQEVFRLVTSPEIPERRRVFYQFAIFTGMRSGELNTLHWEDVDQINRRVRVRFGGVDEAGNLTPTKTFAERWVPLLPLALDALSRVPRTSALVFPGKTGKVVSESRAGKAWKRDLRRIQAQGLFPGRPLTVHSLRHTCATLLASGALGKTWTLEQVQSFLGHESRQTTEIYAHYSVSLALDTARTMH